MLTVFGLISSFTGAGEATRLFLWHGESQLDRQFPLASKSVCVATVGLLYIYQPVGTMIKGTDPPIWYKTFGFWTSRNNKNRVNSIGAFLFHPGMAAPDLLNTTIEFRTVASILASEKMQQFGLESWPALKETQLLPALRLPRSRSVYRIMHHEKMFVDCNPN